MRTHGRDTEPGSESRPTQGPSRPVSWDTAVTNRDAARRVAAGARAVRRAGYVVINEAVGLGAEGQDQALRPAVARPGARRQRPRSFSLSAVGRRARGVQHTAATHTVRPVLHYLEGTASC